MRALLLALLLAADPEHAELRTIYEELVEIDTSPAHGTTRAAEAMAERLRAAGFAAEDVAVIGPTASDRNLVARLRAGAAAGASKPGPLLLLAHLDVVDARREDWSMDPFTLTEEGGYFYGRGSIDDKAMAAIFVTLMVRMQRQGVAPGRDVILALTADEEGGPDNGVDWLLRERRELVAADLVINEGGGGRMREGRYLFNGVQASEKTYMTYRLEVRDKGGHSSVPRRDNAIYRLAAALGRVQAFEFPVRLNEVTRAFFARSAEIESGATAADMKALLAEPPDAEAIARLAETPAYNATLRTTCVATRLAAGHADNALPQSATATVNCRILPGDSPAEVEQTLARVIADPQVTITATEPSTAAPASPLRPDLMAAVEAITEEMWPGVPVIPTMATGATDSRYFRAAGIPAYGVSGIFADVDDIRAHGRDERVGVKQFYDGYEFLKRLVERLAE